MDTPPLLSRKTLLIIVVAMLAVGALAGLGFSQMSGTTTLIAGLQTTPEMINTATEVGLTDTKTFGDSAQGKLEKGGLGGEGTHKLIRAGGSSQTVYLISSIVDLDKYIDQSIEVFGQTLKAQKAPWLMDVGRVKLVQ